MAGVLAWMAVAGSLLAASPASVQVPAPPRSQINGQVGEAEVVLSLYGDAAVVGAIEREAATDRWRLVDADAGRTDTGKRFVILRASLAELDHGKADKLFAAVHQAKVASGIMGGWLGPR